MRKQSTKLRRKRKKACENREATWKRSLGRVSVKVLQPAIKPKWKKVGLE